MRRVEKKSMISIRISVEVIGCDESADQVGPELGEKRVQGDNVVERCRKEGSRANRET